MTDSRHQALFDVSDEPQDNTFRQAKEGLVRAVLDQLDDPLIASAVRNLKEPRYLDRPDPPPEDASEIEKKMWSLTLEHYEESKYEFEHKVPRLYYLVWSQCTLAMQTRLEHRPEFKDIREKEDGIALLKLIKTVSYSYPTSIYPPLAACLAAREFFGFQQGPNMTLFEFRDEFERRWEVLETVGGSGFLTGKINAFPDGQSEQDVIQTHLAAAFLMQADPARFWSLQDNLHNRRVLGRDEYPRTVAKAFHLLLHWIPPGGHSEYDRSTITCFRCRQVGHYRKECPLNNARQSSTRRHRQPRPPSL